MFGNNLQYLVFESEFFITSKKSGFGLTKQHMRKVLLFRFNLKKNAAESHRLLRDAYGEHTLSEITCGDWFRKFKSG